MADIVISSGHAKKVRGASEYLDEVDEARRVVDKVANFLNDMGLDVDTFHDNTSKTQDENLNAIVDFHNSRERRLDVSVHFNAYTPTNEPMGTEVCYISTEELAADLSEAIAEAGDLLDRGPKERGDLFFLNHTEEEAVLIEVCFVDSTYDAEHYNANFDVICSELALLLAEHVGYEPVEMDPPVPVRPPPPLTNALRTVICEMAMEMMGDFDWEDRGTAPAGYTKGFALSWAEVVRSYQQRESSTVAMAAAAGDQDTDALAWYEDEFADLDMDNSRHGLATLRHLFALLMGLGMRESSGRYCEGRDVSADNVTADTAEAGLFQMSWNASNASDEIVGVYEKYSAEGKAESCLLSTYSQDVACSSDELACYGQEDEAGYKFQELAKRCPQFAIEAAAIGLRVIRQHWGPINRLEAELTTEADDLLLRVQTLVIDLPPEV